MKYNTVQKWIVQPVYLAALVLVFLAGCKEEPIVYNTSESVNMTSYLDKYPDQFSEWRKVLELTNTAGFLQAYGSYTLFLPTNDGVKAFLQEKGKTAVEQLDVTELKDIVKFHLLSDTISTTKFNDGKLPSLTMQGQYLITGAANVNGATRIIINRQANMVTANIKVGNGVIHVIDRVLQPSKLTLAKMIEANTAYSIFTQALKETGLYDTLNIAPASNPDAKKARLTALVETDAVFKAAGFNTYADLKARFSKTGNPRLVTDSLHMFMAYHILYEAKYLADIVSAQSHATLANPEIITAKLDDELVLINDGVFNNIYEPGFTLGRTISDNSATNGVMHVTAPYKPANLSATSGHFAIKVRVPFRVDWDVADFPEVRKLSVFRNTGTANFVKPSATAPFQIGGWDFFYRNASTTIGYVNATGGWVYNDYLNMGIGLSSRADWVKMKTPLIVRGRYNVWICYRTLQQSGNGTYPAGSRCQSQIIIDDGEPLAKTHDFCEPMPSGSTAELEALGWKYYTSPVTATNFNSWVAKKVGTVDIKTTDNHILMFKVILGSQSQSFLDMIQFIPVDAPSQIIPRFKTDGTLDNTPLVIADRKI
ncbi:fasciclin domain-containing protein [Hufsiella ginkgonis]|uniref:FAS1 domain-containing protein n=1 Tax=Hufsiella ginkgonis TaxID=2695274 RepID=A0A7K1Y251_9SPHI|nr:fasciclin domain-containing protein [Hufsiella ginkgonis]MXV17340.1 hypothetical protein [Hufsiella ginkgonis]